MTDTSLVFNILAKDKASQVFNQFKLAATHAFDVVAGKAFDFAKESIRAFTEGERSQLLLEDAYTKFPRIADTNIAKMRELDEQIQATTKFDHNAVAAAQAKLAMFNFTGHQIEALTPLMADFAAKTGTDMATAATIFGKAMVGQGRGLKQVGINFKDLGDPTKNYLELQTLLNQKVGGFAEKEGKTAADQAVILKNEFHDLQEKIGGALVPVLQKLVPPLMQVLEWMNKNSGTVTKILTVVGSLIGFLWLLNAAVRAYTIVQIALNIVMGMNPFVLIALAVIALVVAFVILWKKSAAFREFFIGQWLAIKTAVLGVKNDIVNGWNAFIGFFAKLPGRIGHAAAGMWDGITGAFKAAINWIIRKWNALHFTIGGGSFMGFNIPSMTLGVPQIPELDTGGLILRSGIAVVHKGETVTPAGRAGMGSTVHVVLDVRGADADMVRMVRKWVRHVGGKGANSVQIALGQT